MAATQATIGGLLARLRDAGAWDAVVYVVRRYGVSVDLLLSRDRHASVSRARKELMVIMVDTLGFSSKETGRLLGRDHTSVLSVVAENRGRVRRLVEAA